MLALPSRFVGLEYKEKPGPGQQFTTECSSVNFVWVHSLFKNYWRKLKSSRRFLFYEYYECGCLAAQQDNDPKHTSCLEKFKSFYEEEWNAIPESILINFSNWYLPTP